MVYLHRDVFQPIPPEWPKPLGEADDLKWDSTSDVELSRRRSCISSDGEAFVHSKAML